MGAKDNTGYEGFGEKQNKTCRQIIGAWGAFSMEVNLVLFFNGSKYGAFFNGSKFGAYE